MRKLIPLLLLPAFVMGALLSLLTPGANYLTSLVISTLLIWTGLAVLAFGWQKAGGGRILAWMLALAFLLRLGIGGGLSAILPGVGYDTEYQRAGFLFVDAYVRDNQSWQLAQSDLPVYAGISQDFVSDQYGGQLMLSAAVYRTISPDFHRPYLLLILAAFAASLGLLFLHVAVRSRWGEKTANLAGWIYALYPESLLLGGSQLREPYLMALIAVGLWAVFAWKERRLRAALTFAVAIGFLFLLSSRVAAVTFGILIVLFWLEYQVGGRLGKWRWTGWAVMALAAGLVLLLGWNWIQSTAHWDSLITERHSGMVQRIIEDLGSAWRIPFVTVYGLAQPVLPAALVDPSTPFATAVTIFRAVGWYLLLPLLLYALVGLRRAPATDRRVLAWLAGAVLVWVVISSARAGGDMWDNPRYRTILIPLEALLAAWGWGLARQTKDAWLARIAAIEGLFVVLFTAWYYLRYYTTSKMIGFLPLAGIVAGLAAVIVVGGWLWDRRKRAVTTDEEDGHR